MRAFATLEITAWTPETWDESASGTLARAVVTKTSHGGTEGMSGLSGTAVLDVGADGTHEITFEYELDI